MLALITKRRASLLFVYLTVYTVTTQISFTVYTVTTQTLTLFEIKSAIYVPLYIKKNYNNHENQDNLKYYEKLKL